MAYKVIILYQLYMPSYFLGTFTEYPYINKIKILERTIREMESRIIVQEKDPFYKNAWLWISIILGIVLFRRYARN